jgi:hypothetical protein
VLNGAPIGPKPATLVSMAMKVPVFKNWPSELLFTVVVVELLRSKAPHSGRRADLMKLALAALIASENEMFASADHRPRPGSQGILFRRGQFEAVSNQ